MGNIPFPHRRVRIAALVTALAAALLLAGGCDTGFVDPFPEYRGVNLFDAWGVPFDSSRWSIDYGNTGAPMGSYQYLVFRQATAAEAGSTDGLPAGATPMLLQIPNLYPNGDFEATATSTLPAGWSTVGATGEVRATPTDQVIDGKSLYVSTTGSATRVTYNLRDASAGVLDGWMDGAQYGFRFDFNVADAILAFTMEYNDNGGQTTGEVYSRGQEMLVSIPAADDPYVEYEFPGDTGEINLLTVPTGKTNHYLSVGSIQSAERAVGHIDNLRMYRTDIVPAIRVQLLRSDATAELDYQTATYRFSVWVKALPDAAVTPATPNAYRARLFSLVADSTTSLGGASRDYATFEDSTDDEVFDTGAWQKVSLDFQLESIPAADADMVVALSISPDVLYGTVGQGRDIGGVLVAAPELILDPLN